MLFTSAVDNRFSIEHDALSTISWLVKKDLILTPVLGHVKLVIVCYPKHTYI